MAFKIANPILDVATILYSIVTVRKTNAWNVIIDSPTAGSYINLWRILFSIKRFLLLSFKETKQNILHIGNEFIFYGWTDQDMCQYE